MEAMLSFLATEFLILGLLLKLVCGDYILRVEVHNYTNPTNHCGIGCNGGCCDDFDSSSCFGNDGCDSEFFFCVRPLTVAPISQRLVASSVSEGLIGARAGILGCLLPSLAYRSNTSPNVNQIISSGSSTFLGLPNPLEFHVAAARWEGIQFYADVTDRDNGPRMNDELVDIFPIPVRPNDLDSPRELTSRQQTFNGTLLISSLQLTFQVECQPGFVGADCRPAVPNAATTTTVTPPPSSTGDSQSIISTTSTTGDLQVTSEQGPTTYSGPMGAGTFGKSSGADTPTTTVTSGNTSRGFVGRVLGAVVGGVGAIVVLGFAAVCLGLLVVCKMRRGEKRVALNDDIPTANNVAYVSNGEGDSDVIYDYPEGIGLDISSSIKVIVPERVQFCKGNPAYGVLDEDSMKTSEVFTKNNLAYGAFQSDNNNNNNSLPQTNQHF